VPAAIRQAFVLAPRNWWRQWPPIPAPAEDYLRFRSVTAYGGEGTTPPAAEDMAAWLGWVRSWPSVTGGRTERRLLNRLPHARETAPSGTGQRN